VSETVEAGSVETVQVLVELVPSLLAQPLLLRQLLVAAGKRADFAMVQFLVNDTEQGRAARNTKAADGRTPLDEILVKDPSHLEAAMACSGIGIGASTVVRTWCSMGGNTRLFDLLSPEGGEDEEEKENKPSLVQARHEVVAYWQEMEQMTDSEVSPGSFCRCMTRTLRSVFCIVITRTHIRDPCSAL
jgi:hypothetical protein